MELLGNIAREFLLILATGIVLGAGLPALYALGLRVLAWSAGTSDGHTADNPGAKHPVGKWLAYAIFAFTLAIVLWGIAVIIASGLGVSLNPMRP